MSYTKGKILAYEYPIKELKDKRLSKVINDYHMVVVLHKRETPYDTILIAPITSSESLKKVGKIPANFVELLATDYPFVLQHDSYINLDMTLAVDSIALQEIEKNNKKIDSHLKEFDLYQLDYKITLTYELNKFLDTELAIKIHEEFESVVTYIDEDIKTKIGNLVSNINDVQIAQNVITIIDDLIMELKKTYINNSLKKGKYFIKK